MDLSNTQSVINAFENQDNDSKISHVIHVASPINSLEAKTYQDYVDPVINGTNALIKGIKMQNIQKLIVTSTCYTLM
jgi:UDP-glucose 4-epimerase